MSPALAGGFLTTAPPGKSSSDFKDEETETERGDKSQTQSWKVSEVEFEARQPGSRVWVHSHYRIGIDLNQA